MKTIKLTQGQVALVDDADFEELNVFRWQATKGNRRADGTHCMYAVRMVRVGERQRSVRMHRIIMQPGKGLQVDHIDHDGLNNQRSNLRVVTNRENQSNLSRKASMSSRFTGVSWHKASWTWRVDMTLDGKRFLIGHFRDEIDARNAYIGARFGLALAGVA